MKYRGMIPVLVLLLLLSAVLTSAHYLIPGKEEDYNKTISILITERLHDAVEAKLDGPVMTARTISGDTYLKRIVEEEESYSEDELADRISSQLDAVRQRTDCDTAFVVSEKSRRYYSHKGLNKIIDPAKDSHDIWYNNFVGKGLPYALGVDSDEGNDNEWTLFVNVRMEDEDNNLIGVCGVGISMSDIQELFRKYEEEYNIKINLVNSEGLVQVDINNTNIETTYHADQMLSDTEDYVYTKRGIDGYIISKYIKELDWYLVIQDDRAVPNGNEFDMGYIFMAICLFIAAGLCALLILRKNYKPSGYNSDNDSHIDEVTGLHNRNYYKAVYGEQQYFNTTRYKAVALIDVDHFSSAKKEMDGDEILRTVTGCARKVMGEDCEIFRWREDEFTVFMDWSIEFAYKICSEFCRAVENEGKVTVSVGVTEIILSDTIMKNYYRAAQGCYLVKEMGGNGVKRK